MGAPLPETAADGTTLRSFDDLPAPKGLPIVGNVFQIDSMQFHITLENWVAVGPGDGMYNMVDPTDRPLGLQHSRARLNGPHGPEDRARRSR